MAIRDRDHPIVAVFAGAGIIALTFWVTAMVALNVLGEVRYPQVSYGFLAGTLFIGLFMFAIGIVESVNKAIREK